MTGDADVIENPDALYEFVNGERVEKAMSNYENWLGFHLCRLLQNWADATASGRTSTELMFALPNVTNNRRPDVSYVSFAKWPANRRIPRQNAWAMVPDLVVEVVSPTDDAENVMEKTEEYFRGGVTSVWVVLPVQERVYAYSSPTAVRILSRGDDLTDPALPGFRLPLADLFPPPDAP